MTSEGWFTDYRAVGGVLIPHRILEVEIPSGKALAESRVVIAEANTLSDPAIFSLASRPKTPLQDFLEKLYEERSDEASVMYSYRLLRRTHPEIDTRDGIEFIGCQMAKTKDYDSSIVLLKANAADYSTSASAEFGVCRA